MPAAACATAFGHGCLPCPEGSVGGGKGYRGADCLAVNTECPVVVGIQGYFDLRRRWQCGDVHPGTVEAANLDTIDVDMCVPFIRDMRTPGLFWRETEVLGDYTQIPTRDRILVQFYGDPRSTNGWNLQEGIVIMRPFSPGGCPMAMFAMIVTIKGHAI